jgi:hypothetical protein
LLDSSLQPAGSDAADYVGGRSTRCYKQMK